MDRPATTYVLQHIARRLTQHIEGQYLLPSVSTVRLKDIIDTAGVLLDATDYEQVAELAAAQLQSTRKAAAVRSADGAGTFEVRRE